MADTSARPLWLRLAPAIFLVLWSGGFSFAKLGLADAAPLTFLALRYAGVLAILAPLFVLLRPAMPARAAEWGHIAVVGFLIQAVYFSLSYVALKAGMSAGGVALIVSLQPVVVGLAAPFTANERVGAKRWIGLVLGLAGAGLVISARHGIADGSLAGLMAALGALAGIVAGTLYEKRFGLSTHPVSANLIQYAVGLGCLAPAAWLVEGFAFAPTADLAIALSYLVIGNSLISVTLLLAMIRAGEVSRVSALFFMVPPGAALIAWAVIGETLPPQAWLGMALAVIGVWVAMRPAGTAR